MTYAIDFDGVLHDPTQVAKGYKMGKPMDGAVEAMKELEAAGHTLVIYTVRADGIASTRAVMDWLHYFDVPYFRITNVKPNADRYVDDKGYHFTSWKQTLKDLA